MKQVMLHSRSWCFRRKERGSIQGGRRVSLFAKGFMMGQSLSLELTPFDDT